MSVVNTSGATDQNAHGSAPKKKRADGAVRALILVPLLLELMSDHQLPILTNTDPFVVGL